MQTLVSEERDRLYCGIWGFGIYWDRTEKKPAGSWTEMQDDFVRHVILQRAVYGEQMKKDGTGGIYYMQGTDQRGLQKFTCNACKEKTTWGRCCTWKVIINGA